MFKKEKKMFVVAEINCGVSSLTDLKNGTSLVEKINNGSSSNRSARFLGKLALVVGVGNKIFETNLSRPSLNLSSFGSYSPYVAAVYEPYLSSLQSYIPFKWFFNSSPSNSEDPTTVSSMEETNFMIDPTENQTVSKPEMTDEKEYKIIIDQDNETEVNHVRNNKQVRKNCS